MLTYWPDLDGDGFGDVLAGSEITCAPQSGWVADGTDCDDTDEAINPGVDEQVCDGIDNDCDPLTLDMDSSCDTGLSDSAREFIPSDTDLALQGDKVDEVGSGCTCDAAGGPSPGWLALFGLLLARRRRV